MGYVYLTIALVLNALANIFVKMGSGNLIYFKEYGLIGGLLKNYILILGCLLFAFNMVFYVLALSKLSLSVAYPVAMGGTLIIVVLISYFFLKEIITPAQLVGMSLIFAGVVFLTTKW